MDNELYDDDSNGPPEDDVVLQSNTQSEAQLCVQRMLGQQLDTDISLEQYAVKHKSFTPAVTFRSFIEQASGKLSLEQFEVLEKEHRSLDELRACGLSDQEIALKLENEGGHLSSLLPPSKRSSYLADPIARKKRLIEVEGKIHQRQKNLGLTLEEHPTDNKEELKEESKDGTGREHSGESHPTSSRLLVRHPTTLGLAYIHPDDPINHLDDIAASLFGKNKDKQNEDVSASTENATSPGCGANRELSTGCCGDKWRSGEMVWTESKGFLKETLEDADHGGLSQGCSSMSEGKSQRQDSVLTSLTETDSHGRSEIRNLANTPHVGSSPEADSKTKISNHAIGDCGTGLESQSADPRVPGTCGSVQVTDNEPRRLAGVVRPLSREELLKHRLTTDDICKMDRFRDYSMGQPSKVLFLKNLSAKVTEEDLASVFMSFQHQDKPKIVFKLLKGRMKGQAFVTFADSETAGEAQSHVNGYPLRGKPVIIQYGKQR
ncbi:RNA-binding protein 41-like [Asterias amurensis]|uniref:RNA-binding protein 41-like n=1 Tax=Asterias amurensis TaxID=7602 RepID=UPI003AB51076